MSEQISQCEQCEQRYNLFRRKKQCNLCGQIFCSKCAPKSTIISLQNSRACSTCLFIINERTSRDQLATIRVKHLRAYLIHSKIVSRNRLDSYFEKQDLINLIESKKRYIPNNTYIHAQQEDLVSSINTDNDHREVQQESINENEQVPSDESPLDSLSDKIETTRITLNDITSLESIRDLTVRQLKEILIQNFVSIKGCVEKTDLITKVELLYRDQQYKQSDITVSTDQSNENLCKVCMDANIDCVFLDCGHLCTCIQCGKQLSECPLCRSYIIRVVRVFKS